MGEGGGTREGPGASRHAPSPSLHVCGGVQRTARTDGCNRRSCQRPPQPSLPTRNGCDLHPPPRGPRPPPGVIGRRLKMEAFIPAIPQLIPTLGATTDDAHRAAVGITTTGAQPGPQGMRAARRGKARSLRAGWDVGAQAGPQCRGIIAWGVGEVQPPFKGCGVHVPHVPGADLAPFPLHPPFSSLAGQTWCRRRRRWRWEGRGPGGTAPWGPQDRGLARLRGPTARRPQPQHQRA